jgi:hypothetical protein
MQTIRTMSGTRDRRLLRKSPEQQHPHNQLPPLE